MAADQLVLSRAALAVALVLLLARAAAALPGPAARAAPAATEVGERYRALCRAVELGQSAAAAELAAGFAAEDVLGAKARALAALAQGLAGAAPLPAAPHGAAEIRVGGLAAVLLRDGSFAAALLPERGAGGVRPLLAGWPAPFTSRATLSVDGAAIALSERGQVAGSGSAASLRAREGDVELTLTLTAAAPSAGDQGLAAGAVLRLELTVLNAGSAARVVGARLLLDVADGFDDAPAIGCDARRASVLGQTYEGDGVPRRLQIGERSIQLRGLGTPAPGRAVVAPLERAAAAAFDFPVAEGEMVGADAALALYLEPRTLSPGEARRFAVELQGERQDLDPAPPVAAAAWTEPVDGMPLATRVVLAVDHAERGASAAPLLGLAAEVRLPPGLAALDAGASLAEFGALPRDGWLLRSLVVAPDGTERGPFDVKVRLRSGGSERELTATVQASARADFAGRVTDIRGTPVPGADVVLLRDGQEVARGSADAAGAFRFAGLEPLPHRVRASAVVHREPAAKAERADVDGLLYDVLLTSETIDDAGRTALPELLPGSGRAVVLSRSVTRYSLLVSVEWDAPRDYLESVARGMRRAAEFLYSASDGQLTFGRVAIHDAGRDWNSADFWDWANNSVHPNASVAGIRHRYHPQYAPWNTAINFGRQWAPAWDEPGLYRTVVHEFGHYGLGLYDEYLGAPEGVGRGLAYPEMCRCIMGYQYADHKICWDGNHRAYTNQGMWNGRSCWRQIEDWHEGERSGFRVPVTTPMERGGVVPPVFANSIGNDVKVVIRDVDTGGFGARLSVAGPFGASQSGVLVYVDQQGDGRTLYQGVSRGDGALELMGVHPGDRVWGLFGGARAELTLGERRAEYLLEFGSEPNAAGGAAALVRVLPERGPDGALGAAVEVVPLAALSGTPALYALSNQRREVPLAPLDSERFLGALSAADAPAGRAALELHLPDAIRGDSTVVADAVLMDVAAGASAVVASFDGSVEVRIAPGAIGAPVALTSTAGPQPFAEGELIGRVHALAAAGERSAFAGPVIAEFSDADAAAGAEPCALDPRTGALAPLPRVAGAPEGAVWVELDGPCWFALVRR